MDFLICLQGDHAPQQSADQPPKDGRYRIQARAWGAEHAPKNSLSRAQTGCEQAKLPPQCWSILSTVDIR